MNTTDNENIIATEETCKTKCINYTIEGVGWIGSGLVLSAYFLNLSKHNDFLLNTIGSGALIGVCYNKKAYQPLAINGLWVIVGLYKYFFTVS